ncbi:MAG: hypothetical protein MJK11_04740, partial [Pseudomonadales bacterium]|nr:hypothetical protein [Pseudomonadales bacterium]
MHNLGEDQTHVSLINYSGCNNNHTFEQCIANNKLIIELPITGDENRINTVFNGLGESNYN